jgi:hypothetical protein
LVISVMSDTGGLLFVDISERKVGSIDRRHPTV